MKHKTSELTGAMLDAAVAKANGMGFEIHHEKVWGDGCGVTIINQTPACWTGAGYYEPSTDWRTGGPIIEREKIAVIHCPAGFTAGEEWEAYMGYVDPRRLDLDPADGEGPTPLIAAMRAYVVSKLGDEVEL